MVALLIVLIAIVITVVLFFPKDMGVHGFSRRPIKYNCLGFKDIKPGTGGSDVICYGIPAGYEPNCDYFCGRTRLPKELEREKARVMKSDAKNRFNRSLTNIKEECECLNKREGE